MIQKLETLLFEKTKGSQSDILYTQWIYDKKLVPKALSLISGIFPHYSMHDTSHSETIINNIVRIIGIKTIEQLSAIDIWFLLTSAYYHDIGMAIPADKLDEALKEENFLTHIVAIQKNSSHPLNEYAVNFEKKGNELHLCKQVFDINIYDSIKFLLADYFRQFHAHRSEKIIIDPMQEISLASPRGIIPRRIMRILGLICSCHTKPFCEVFDLPYKEVGLDIYDAHPRYIACLLRLGDLLDLDNNRFSDVFLRSVNSIPYDSLLHKNKHFSISHFCIDANEIDILANCDSYDVANITQSWFSYIREEISNQMLNWNNISPSTEYGHLPTIKKLNVELKDWKYISEHEKPTFKVDTEEALELLKGAGLYNSPWQAIRELLQNSVDASLIRLWLERDPQEKLDTPLDKYYAQQKSKYPIAIAIDKATDKEDSQPKNKKQAAIDKTADPDKDDLQWDITITDNGTGISLEDLKYLSLTGSSHKNKKRRQVIDEMPEWLRPSGTFGIGFQSIFMLTNKVTIVTKSFFTGQVLEIEMYNPKCANSGQILIRELDDPYKYAIGSKISFRVKTKHATKHDPYSKHHRIAAKRYLRYSDSFGVDPFDNADVSIEIENIIRQANTFTGRAPFPISLIIDKQAKPEISNPDKEFKYYIPDKVLEINIKPKKNIKQFDNRIYYKNQPVNTFYKIFNFLNVDVNILKSNTREILNLDRNTFKSSYFDILIQDIKEVVISTIPQYIKDNPKSTDTEIQLLSMFIHFYWDNGFANKFYDKSEYVQWQDYPIQVDGNSIKLKELISTVNEIEIHDINEDEDLNESDESIHMKDNKLIINQLDTWNDDIFEFLAFIFRKNGFPEVSEVRSEAPNQRKIILSKKKLYTSDEIISDFIKNEGNDYKDYIRYAIPCQKEFEKLRIKDDSDIGIIDFDFFPDYIGDDYPKMISPYIAERKQEKDENGDPITEIITRNKMTDYMVNWVYENRYYPDTTKEEIEALYKKFTRKYDKLVFPKKK